MTDIGDQFLVGLHLRPGFDLVRDIRRERGLFADLADCSRMPAISARRSYSVLKKLNFISGGANGSGLFNVTCPIEVGAQMHRAHGDAGKRMRAQPGARAFRGAPAGHALIWRSGRSSRGSLRAKAPQ